MNLGLEETELQFRAAARAFLTDNLAPLFLSDAADVAAGDFLDNARSISA